MRLCKILTCGVLQGHLSTVLNVRLTSMRLSPSKIFYSNVENVSLRNNKQMALDIMEREN
jgi:hypothetical protein